MSSSNTYQTKNNHTWYYKVYNWLLSYHGRSVHGSKAINKILYKPVSYCIFDRDYNNSKKFLGTTENAIRIQIYVAICT